MGGPCRTRPPARFCRFRHCLLQSGRRHSNHRMRPVCGAPPPSPPPHPKRHGYPVCRPAGIFVHGRVVRRAVSAGVAARAAGPPDGTERTAAALMPVPDPSPCVWLRRDPRIAHTLRKNARSAGFSILGHDGRGHLIGGAGAGMTDGGVGNACGNDPQRPERNPRRDEGL